MKRILPCFVLALTLTSCLSIRGQDGASAASSIGVVSQYWFRGIPQSERAVLQGDLSVAVPLADGGTMTLSSWGNFQLTDSTGDAVIADGNERDLTEIDVVGSYARTIGQVSYSAGVISYTFPQGVGATTNELFLGASTEAFGVTHTATAYYDVNEAEDLYLSYSAAKSFDVADKTTASVNVLLGYMFDGQGEFYFGDDSAGLSDLSLNGALNYAYDEHTTLFVRASAVTVPDSEFQDAEDARGFDDSGFWLAIGSAWTL